MEYFLTKNNVYWGIASDHEFFFFQTTVCWFSLDKLNDAANLKMNVVFFSYKKMSTRNLLNCFVMARGSQ